ncbi:MAG: glycosyltransferase family 4 protein [Christensenellaceae bacterium]|jgi:glycosyltransferase involved in cell wall biosynthesis
MKRKLKTAFVSTYPPRECGIATFTEDIIRELKKMDDVEVGIVALNDDAYRYPEDVVHVLEQQEKEAYLHAAKYLNKSPYQVVMVEHEYGIFGGADGAYLLDFVDALKKPAVATLHTVLPSPSSSQKEILKTLCEKSEAVVLMSENSMEVLHDVYEVPREKMIMIHHGVPNIELRSKKELRKAQEIEEGAVISTFGLLAPGKGLEYGIEAMAEVVKKHPKARYYVIGKTHPVIQREQGESYRHSLERLARTLGIAENIRFINAYLEKQEIMEWLKLSDIYLTPYLGKDQAVSGTLAYAVGSGTVIVSTPYRYAEEMLAENRGILADFNSAESLADAITFLLDNEETRKRMECNTKRLGGTMTWDQVAKQYKDVLISL